MPNPPALPTKTGDDGSIVQPYTPQGNACGSSGGLGQISSGRTGLRCLARFHLVEPGSERAQVPGAVLGRVAWGDVHGAAQTEARGGDGGGGAEVRDRAARTEARGGGGCGGAEIREQAEHDIAVMGMRTRRALARILASLRPLTRVSARQNMSQMFAN